MLDALLGLGPDVGGRLVRAADDLGRVLAEGVGERGFVEVGVGGARLGVAHRLLEFALTILGGAQRLGHPGQVVPDLVGIEAAEGGGEAAVRDFLSGHRNIGRAVSPVVGHAPKRLGPHRPAGADRLRRYWRRRSSWTMRSCSTAR